MKYFSLVFILLMASAYASQEETGLQKACAKNELTACENLSGYYLKVEKWDNAFVIGEALCNKDIMKGCTFAGTFTLAINQHILTVTVLCLAQIVFY